MASCTRTSDATKRSGNWWRNQGRQHRFGFLGARLAGDALPAADAPTAIYSISASSLAFTIASSLECTPSLLPRLRMWVRTVV